MKYFKYYVFGYYGETLATMNGFNNIADARDLARGQKKYCAYTTIEICQISCVRSKLIERYEE